MTDPPPPSTLSAPGLEAMFSLLRARGYRVIGPTARDGAIIYDDIATIADLPAGWTDEQDAGRYRLKRREDAALFGYAVGPHSWKRFLHPPMQTLWRARRDGDDVAVTPTPVESERFAFIGVRACELAAIAVQDRVFMGEAHVDPHYKARREHAFLVAVNCGAPAATCFCASMNTGPKARAGYDLALTELLDGDEPRYLVEAGSEAGAEILAALPQRAASADDVAAADAVVNGAAAAMGRAMRADARETLAANPEHARWDDVAERCLSCGNCTMVCPTCFCTTTETATDLTGAETIQARRWDSCFTNDFSYLHGGPVRPSTRSHYRQWLTHKLSTWHDQFDMSGCVGCGRCISWCPVGIDITEEAAAIGAAQCEPGAGS